MSAFYVNIMGLSLKKKAVLYREMATIVKAGLTPYAALEASGKGCLPDIRHLVFAAEQEGKPISWVLEQNYPGCFTHYEREMIKVGEYSGRLDQQLQNLASEFEQRNELRSTVVSASVYPAITVIVGIAVFSLLRATMGVLTSQSSHLSLSTGVITAISLYSCLLALVLCCFILSRLKSLGSDKVIFLDSFLWRMPGVKLLVCSSVLSRFCSSLASLLDGGVLADKAFTLAAKECGNAYLSQKLLAVAPKIVEGNKISSCLTLTGEFPAIAITMLSTGESSGNESESLAHCAKYLRDEAQEKMAIAMKLFPAILLIAIGGAVMYMVINFYCQYFSAIMP